MKIVYNSEHELAEYNEDKFYESLNRYGNVPREAIRVALSELHYDPMHYSVLVEVGTRLIPDDDMAKKYFEEHSKPSRRFERLARITGYLTGDISRWNIGKMKEWSERTVSSINGEYSPENKALIAHKKKVLREQYLNNV